MKCVSLALVQEFPSPFLLGPACISFASEVIAQFCRNWRCNKQTADMQTRYTMAFVATLLELLNSYGFVNISKRTSGRHLGIADWREIELISRNPLFSAGKCLRYTPEY
jgi:hypothetical protein